MICLPLSRVGSRPERSEVPVITKQFDFVQV
jgi:hypothetical protein